MKNYNSAFQEVIFSFTYDALMPVIHAESAYIAKTALLNQVEGDVRTAIDFTVTDDEEHFVRLSLQHAHTILLTRLSAYLAESTDRLADTWVVRLLLPERRKSEYDQLIMSELQRAYVTYVLACWYENSLPDVAARHRQLFDAAVSTAMHDIFMLHGGMKRKACYF